MKICEQGPVGALDRVGDANGFQVHADHFRGPVLPASRPKRGIRRQAVHELPKGKGDVGRQRLRNRPAILGMSGPDHDQRRKGFQIE
ncbi:MAG: hypothetical protein HY040_18690 [Planctomycetes bacterium]|nr:hypothetical protein [Planctomycetota bacterium]